MWNLLRVVQLETGLADRPQEFCRNALLDKPAVAPASFEDRGCWSRC